MSSIINLNDLFGPDEDQMVENKDKIGTIEVELSRLVHFRNHPFKLYEGGRLEEMIESIKEYGIITPLIVRPLEDNKYEILSGHNRANAGKFAGLEKVPVVIKEDLTDEEAMLIVTETNLQQRSLEELSHSEKARIFSERHEAIKKQGRNRDIINEIEIMSNTDSLQENSDSSPGGTRRVAEEYRMGKSTVARYLRINKLNNSLKEKVDKGDIPLKAGVELSYLNEDNQNILNDLVDKYGYKVNFKKASELKRISNRNLNPNKIRDVLSGEYFEKPKKNKQPKLTARFSKTIVSKYVNEERSVKEVEEIIEALLEDYFSEKNE